ncbi:MAG: ferrous iron transport protein B [Candidatus Latescibacteria bacterium]|nr:ferrous iron transport protein B [Candidatus Latescibacterota bacterium]
MSKTAPTIDIPPNQLAPADVALIGNPNTGKTSIFNALTGLRQKIGNYPGVTVERKSGIMDGPEGAVATLHDLPGLYSLNPKSLDEKIARDVLLGESHEDGNIKLVVVVVDAANLSRNLYLVSQVIDLDISVIVALNMMDSAENAGVHIDVQALSKRLSVPVVPIVATRETGIDLLRKEIFAAIKNPSPELPDGILSLDDTISTSIAPVSDWLIEHTELSSSARIAEALRIISSDISADVWRQIDGPPDCLAHFNEFVADARAQLEERDISWRMLEATLRYRQIDEIYADTVREVRPEIDSISVRLDMVLTHRFAGPIIVVVLFALIFQTVFSWAEWPMDLIESAVASAGAAAATQMPEGMIRNLTVDGIIAGVGAVLVFLPQILFLFFFLALLEDTGYMARVAFLMDRLMKSLGLSGRSVIPLLSSFACAIPGIMATRTISSARDRLITIMIAPLMSCSARLPVYVLMIGAFVPNEPVLVIFSLPGVTLLTMYLLGICAAIAAALVFKRVLKQSDTPTSFIMELPPYRRPSIRWVLMQMYERARIFITDAGQIILAISIVLWFLASYPQADSTDNLTPRERISESYAGQLGHAIEPAIKPLGFDWKLGIGLITSFAAREVLVSTMATIYNVEEASETSVDLRTALRNETDPVTGERVYTPLVAVSLMVFFVLACQCMATVAIVKRETNSWLWPTIMVSYMTGLAYLASLIVYQTGIGLGLG